jgi:hypothetical protein
MARGHSHLMPIIGQHTGVFHLIVCLCKNILSHYRVHHATIAARYPTNSLFPEETMNTEAPSLDFEIFDSAHPVPDESEYQKQRSLLWRMFCDSVRAQPDHAERLRLALDILGAILDSPEIPVDVLLAVLQSVAVRGASC